MEQELAPAQFKIHMAPERVPIAIENMRWVAKNRPNILRIRQLPEHKGTCGLVGGSPSVTSFVEQIRETRQGPWNLLASLNCVHSWLIERDIIPSIHVLFEMDADPAMVLGKPHPDVVYYVCSHCPPSTFEYLDGYKVALWHCWNDPLDYDMAVATLFPGEFMVAGGYSTFFRTLNIGMLLGYRGFDIFGCDSSFTEDDKTHLDGYPGSPNEEPIDVWGVNTKNGEKKKFRTLGSLAFQVDGFKKFCTANSGRLRVRVFGDGLLPYMHRMDHPDQYQP